MVDIYKTDNRILSKLGSIEEGCWINMVNPTSSELSLISGYFEEKRYYIECRRIKE